MKQLPAAAQAMLATKGMRIDAPIFVRIFKEESQLEVWKLKGDRFELFKTYPICAWSGELGPKVTVGDKQAPEGFYTVTPGQMNPKSQFHLAFNIGYPNAYDQANHHTGSALMVHGDCRSAGCFAMTDALIEEIYILAREAFKGGQTRFHVNAFPFRMTEANMKLHRDSKWYPFWVSMKQGYDSFEKTHKPPLIKVCARKYLVNVEFLGHVAEPQPQDACPLYAKIDPEKLPGIDGVPPTLLASLKGSSPAGSKQTPVPVAIAEAKSAPVEPKPARVERVASASASTDKSMSASPVVRTPRASAVMASFHPPVKIAPKPPEVPVVEVTVAHVPEPAAPAPSHDPVLDAPVAAPLPATPMEAAAPATPDEPKAEPEPTKVAAAPEAPPSRYVDPNAMTKPNRSGKGGKLTVEPQAEASTGNPAPTDSSVALGFSGTGAPSQ